jgi:hypothetical protein
MGEERDTDTDSGSRYRAMALITNAGQRWQDNTTLQTKGKPNIQKATIQRH